MISIPQAALAIITAFAPAFTESTFRRFVVLTWAAILTAGRGTISNLLRAVALYLAPGHPASYRGTRSKRRWLYWLVTVLYARLRAQSLPSGRLDWQSEGEVVTFSDADRAASR